MFCESLGSNGMITLKTKTSSIAKTKKFSFDSIVMVSFGALRYDCHERTMMTWGGSIRFPYNYEEFEKVEYVIFDMAFK